MKSKKVILLYKKFGVFGGAERLLLKEYKYFKEMSYDVLIVSFDVDSSVHFLDNIPKNDIQILGANWLIGVLKLVYLLTKNRGSLVLCASGFIEVYIASLISKVDYFLHIHHPLFMTFNDYDKYSFFLRKHFDDMVESNFGAERFKEIRDNITFFNLFYINIHAFLTINSYNRSKGNFVMSRAAKDEKDILFKSKSHIVCGAIEEEIFDYKPNLIQDFDSFDYKILSLCRLDKNKRVDVIIRSFSLFLRKNPNSILLIIGQGEERKNLEKLVVDLGINENVKFLGFVDERYLYDYYASVDISVLVDWADYRITAFESLAMGTKVLMSSEADYDTSIKNAGYIYLTKPTPDCIAKELDKALLCNVTIDRTTLIKFLKKYTWSNYAKKIIKIMEEKSV